MRTVSRLTVASLVAAGALVLAPGSASAQPCDFLTGGGFIVRPNGAKANFGVAGGCKKGSPTFGHLTYTDHGIGLRVQWISVTAYFFDLTGQTLDGTRFICGRARTNLFGDVDWVVRARDVGEPGRNDEFSLQLARAGQVVYSTFPDPDVTLGGPGSGGGNIQRHKPNRSTMGAFSQDPNTCPAVFARF
jgi:hypothetical protein